MTDPEDPNDEGADKRRHERRGVLLRVDYDGVDDLLGDFTENLSSGGTFVVTTRQLEIGSPVRLVLSFPGLLQPIHVDGVVRWTRGGVEDTDLEPGIGIEFTDAATREQLANLVERIRRGDPGVFQRVVRVLLVEDNPHVAELIREGLKGSSKREAGNCAFGCVSSGETPGEAGDDRQDQKEAAGFGGALGHPCRHGIGQSTGPPGVRSHG